MCSVGSFGCQFSVKIQHSAVTADDENSTGRAGRLGLDWWATIVAGVVVLLAVAGLLPKIPW
jgi:hypothetical protein